MRGQAPGVGGEAPGAASPGQPPYGLLASRGVLFKMYSVRCSGASALKYRPRLATRAHQAAPPEQKAPLATAQSPAMRHNSAPSLGARDRDRVPELAAIIFYRL